MNWASSPSYEQRLNLNVKLIVITLAKEKNRGFVLVIAMLVIYILYVRTL